MLLSQEPWILGGKLSPDPSLTEAPETGYLELVLVRILLRGKYSELVYLVFKGKTKVLPAVWMY